MEQERGCGWGCGILLLGLGVFALCLVVPFVGMPLGLMLIIGAVVAAYISRRRDEDEDEESAEKTSD